MSRQELPSINWHHWTTFGLRWFFLLCISLVLYWWRSQSAAVETTDMLLAFGVGAVATLTFGATLFIKSFRTSAPFVLIGIDWLFTGLYFYVLHNSNTAYDSSTLAVFLIGIAGFLAVTGLLNLGVVFGSFQATGVIAIALGALMLLGDGVTVDQLIDVYALPAMLLLMLTIGTGLWVYARAQFGEGQIAQLNQLAQNTSQQLDDMRERTRSVAELSSMLMGTLDFEKILEITLGIGEISLHKEYNKRLISMVMLFRSTDEKLYIADYRGLHNATDTSRIIPGKAGLVGRALDECVPIIGTDAWKDAELNTLGGMNDIRSVLCIPLRANFDNYGVLVFGSEERDAFNEDHIDTLQAIGVQAATALQNAVLYNNLKQEKERILAMEENARKELVRDLHDIPTQTISAVAMRLRIAMRLMERTPEDVPGELVEIEQMALRATEEIRHVLFKLRPLVLESRGLAAALEELGEKMKKTYKQDMVVKVSKDVEKYLDEIQRDAIFYLIEEAANNARKYAEASLISVQLVRQNNVLGIQIRDNGKGFDAEGIEGRSAEQGSFGMTNMRERAELIDGRLQIKSVPGHGTTITVMVPIDPSRMSHDGNGRHERLPQTKLAVSVRSKI